MRPVTLVLLLSAIAAATARFVVDLPENHEGVNKRDQFAILPHPHDPHNPPPEMVDVGTQPATGLSLADALTIERKASLWWDYARDVASITSRLTNKGETTLLVPVDSAIMKMSHKPHQNPDGTPEKDSQVQPNIENFLSAHIVPADLPMPGEEDTPTLLKGVKVRVSGKEGEWRVQPGDIPVLSVKEASNGKILYLGGVVGY